MDELTRDALQEALRIAGELIDAGIPVFAAPPCPSGPFAGGADMPQGPCPRKGHHAGGQEEYDLPAKWQLTVPSRVWLERWRPGWALAAVGGAAADFLDEDPRNGGDASVGQLVHEGLWPRVFGVQSTPSGGRHYVISPLGERKGIVMPGLDYQGGLPTDGKGGGGQGRGFVWIAPTVRRSKMDGELRPYVWAEPPDIAALAAARDVDGGDRSGKGVRDRLTAARAAASKTQTGSPATGVSTGGGGVSTLGLSRQFTLEQAREFCDIPLRRLMTAEIGEIEDRANDAACALSHFVPAFFSEEQAYAVLLSALGETAYDPEHPASRWTAEKFRAVLVGQGGRAPDDWRAAYTPATPAEAAATVVTDEVDALIAEMLPPAELAARRPPRYMVKGLLSYDSVTWLTGGAGSKKSFVVLDIAAHVALGRPWQGHRVNRGMAILIVGEGTASIGKRISAWQKEYGPMPEGGIRILPHPVQAKDLHAWAVLVAAVARLRGALDPELGMFIAVDTQARSTVGIDENSAEEMGIYVQALDALKSASGGCVMSVHHTTKAGGVTRGSGAQDGAQDSRLLLRGDKGTLVSKLYVDKQKDIEEAEPIELRFHKMDLGLDEDEESITSLVLTPRDAWRSALFDEVSASGVAAEEMREVTPFEVRSEPETWTHRLTIPRADVQRWLLQTLKDVGRERGLTQAEWRDLVATKIGRLRTAGAAKMTMDGKVWKEAFQAVIESTHPAARVVVQVPGSDRWTVDPVEFSGFIAERDATSE